MSENKKPFYGFVGPTYNPRVRRLDAQRCINFYLEMDEEQTGKGGQQVTMIGRGGLTKIQTVGQGPIRATYTVSNQALVIIVSGNEVFTLTGANAIPQQVTGNLTTSTGPISITDNGNQVLMVDGINGYWISVQGQNTSGSDVVTFTSTISGTSSTGLTGATTYTANVTVDGTVYNLSILGSNAATFTALIDLISAGIDNTALVQIVGTQIIITSNTSGSSSEVIIADTGSHHLFGSLTGYSSIGTPVPGTSATSILNQITDPNFYPSHYVSFQDGYFILNQTGTTNFFLSDLYAVTWPALNQEAKTGNPDILQVAVSVSRQLYLLGANTTEIWYDAGTSGSSPFARQDGRFSQIGCAAPASVVVLNEQFFWLGSNAQGGGMVYTLTNSLPTRVSNHAVEKSIQESTGNIGESTAFALQIEGHYFYCLNVPGTNTTWVYDMDNLQWVEFQSNINGVQTAWNVSTHCVLNDQHILGDSVNGNIYLYDLNAYTDNGNPIYHIRQTPHVADNLNNVFYHLLECDFTFGVGVANQGNPRVTLEISNDGGATWSNPIFASLGPTGEYYQRARWQRLGKSRDRVFRVSVTDAVQCELLSAMLDMEVGSA